jgi:hypothetical protein
MYSDFTFNRCHKGVEVDNSSPINNRFPKLYKTLPANQSLSSLHDRFTFIPVITYDMLLPALTSAQGQCSATHHLKFFSTVPLAGSHGSEARWGGLSPWDPV